MLLTYITPDKDENQALAVTTHLAIVAHQDDAEIIGYSGIHECFLEPNQWISSFTLTNGAVASRGGKYDLISNDQLSNIRQKEQIKAAQIGEYAFCKQWDCSSSDLKASPKEMANKLARELSSCRPNVIYTHNPADKHATHITTCRIAIEAVKAMREIDPTYNPKVLGVEVWGSLDWLPEEYKIELDCSPMPNLEQALIGIYDSQIDGNKGYDKAVLGRRIANATFTSSHQEDSFRAINLALDLSPLLHDKSLTIEQYLKSILDTFIEEKMNAIAT